MRRRNFMAMPAVAAARAGGLDEVVGREVRGFEGEVWIFAKNLDTGAAYGLKEDGRVRTASTIKLPIMAAVYEKARLGEVRWDEWIALREEDKVSGSGVLHEFMAGTRLSLRDLVRLMIVVSDNTATNLVLDRISAQAVNVFMDKLGLKETRSLRKVRGDGTKLKPEEGWSEAGLKAENKKYGLGVATSREMVALVEKLARGEVVSAEASAEMMATLERQQFKDGIGRKLAKYKVASKSGSLDALRSDVALVTTKKGRVAMAITVDGMKDVDYTEDNQGLLLIARLAPLLVEGLGA